MNDLGKMSEISDEDVKILYQFKFTSLKYVHVFPSFLGNRFRPFLSIKVDGCTDYINAVYIDVS